MHSVLVVLYVHIGALKTVCTGTLDVTFNEDYSRIRKDNGPENFAVLRHIALSLLKQDSSHKTGIANKRLKAALDQDYLYKILTMQ
ncbi:Uncharacterised protein [Candidatus Venteria ishoeyi]|uniref:Transposase n=1 Tax=Candidatus Venteria ishoeyi TaxID=1899563 RepID=A0A1H6F3Z0_9GAMM|nr:Uncharacterised protein [Candidatus Venteria ishoeyi]